MGKAKLCYVITTPLNVVRALLVQLLLHLPYTFIYIPYVHVMLGGVGGIKSLQPVYTAPAPPPSTMFRYHI